ncbi:MAG: helix-turn-helix domain-containing protein [Chthoniobacterales bacterium]
MRLCKARREILGSGYRNLSVTDAAMAWGFNHLGRFSAEYRQFFGELPSSQKSSDAG